MDNIDFEDILRRNYMRRINKKGRRLAVLCVFNKIGVEDTVHKVLWVSPHHTTENQTQHICMTRRFRRSVEDTRSWRGAGMPSVHHLVVVKMKPGLRKH